MEIKVGEYVRTTDGYIGKLVEITNATNYYKIDVGREIQHCDYMRDNYIYSRDGFGHKHSPNIIDLIEVGDYLNGEQIDFINISKAGNKRPLIRDNIYFFDKYSSIKTIVTHEQFKGMEYKV